MGSCSCCGSSIPDGQGVCSMCYGDPGYGRDGYYEQWIKELEQKEQERLEAERHWAEQQALQQEKKPKVLRLKVRGKKKNVKD